LEQIIMRARIWVPILVAGVIAVAFIFGRLQPRSEGATERTAIVESGPLAVFVTGTGKVEPAAQAALFFQIGGTLGQLRVEVGEQVRAGQILASLEPVSLGASMTAAEADLLAAQQALDALWEPSSDQQITQAELAIAQARDALHDAEYRWSVQQEGNRASSSTIRGAEARLVLARKEYEQAKGDYDQFSGRPKDDPARALAATKLAGAEADRDSALRNLNWYTGRPTEIQQAILDAEVAVAEANLKQAEQDLADLLAGADSDDIERAEARLRAAQAVVDQARLIAPIDGTVLSVAHAVGDSIIAGQIEIVIADLTALHVDTTVDELDIALIDFGQAVEITLDALPDLFMIGRVSGIDLSPANDTASTQYPLRVELTELDAQVRVGMTAAISVLVAEDPQAVLVPNWALGFDADTGEVFVTVHRGEARQRAVIELGLRNETVSQVLSGVEVGTVIGISIEEEGPGSRGGFFGGG
jgi:HlyD family secretion protein